MIKGLCSEMGASSFVLEKYLLTASLFLHQTENKLLEPIRLSRADSIQKLDFENR